MDPKRKYYYQFFGTLVINFFFFSLIAVNNQLHIIHSFHIAAALACLYYLVLSVSGKKTPPHFTPSLTFSSYITADCSLRELLLFLLAQLLGTFVGTIGALLLFSNTIMKLSLTAETLHFSNNDIPELQIIMIVLFTSSFVLGFVYSTLLQKNGTFSKRGIPLYCITIFIITLVSLPITGTGIHPGRLLVLMLFSKEPMHNCLYTGIAILGTISGTLIYHWTTKTQDNRAA